MSRLALISTINLRTTPGYASVVGQIDELRDHYDNADMSESIRSAAADTTVASEVMVSTSIRLPQSLMDQVRSRTEAVGVPATTLIREWVLDRITADQSSAVISVADLERFIAERSHPAA